jgi:threonine aldolase
VKCLELFAPPVRASSLQYLTFGDFLYWALFIPFIMRTVDLRSDTVTLPTQEMLDAILVAKLGDDIHEEDETVKKLEELAAHKLGKEAGLLVPSGTMGNLLSILTQTRRGNEVIVGKSSHIFLFEVGGMACIAGAQARTLDDSSGSMNPVDIKAAIRPDDIHHPKPALLCLENTHNMAGGTCLTPGQMSEYREIADRANLKLHVDGARIFNSAIAQSVAASKLVKDADSIMFCLSKGLSAPIGSMLVGTKDFIGQARKNRKMLGGGMRQAGIIAAPGIIALNSMVDRLIEDHENARLLAVGLSKMPGIIIDLKKVQTNIVRFDLDGNIDGPAFIEKLAQQGIKAFCLPGYGIRMVTHRHISEDDINYTLATVGQMLK